MARPTLRAAILVISTTAARDPSSDASDATLRDVFEQEGGGQWDVVDTKIVPDSVPQIQRQILLWADIAESVNLIITTGGTGFAIGDHTPEVCRSYMLESYAFKSTNNGQAVSAVLHKQASGLVHGMLAASLSVTPCKYAAYIFKCFC